MAHWPLCNRLRSARPRQSSLRTCDWDRLVTNRAFPTGAGQNPEASTVDKDLPYQTCAHKKDRSQMERPLPNLIIPMSTHPYSPEQNFRILSRPRSSSAFDVAYDTPMCSLD